MCVMNYDYDYGFIHNLLLFSGENEIFDGKQSHWMNKIDIQYAHKHMHTHTHTPSF